MKFNADGHMPRFPRASIYDRPPQSRSAASVYKMRGLDRIAHSESKPPSACDLTFRTLSPCPPSALQRLAAPPSLVRAIELINSTQLMVYVLVTIFPGTNQPLGTAQWELVVSIRCIVAVVLFLCTEINSLQKVSRMEVPPLTKIVTRWLSHCI